MGYLEREQMQREFYESLNHYKDLTPNQVAITIADVSTSVLAANPNRKRLFIRNASASNVPIYVHFGSDTATTSNGVPLVQGETYEPPVCCTYTGEIKAISGSAASKLLYIEEWY